MGEGRIIDLGTFGGDNGEAAEINDAGDVVGSTDFPGDRVHHAALWSRGVLSDLGTVDGDACSRAWSINARRQIVGGSGDCATFLHAFLSEDGGPMLDLNTLISGSSGLQVTEAFDINDRGEIAAAGTLSNGDARVFLLIPCAGDEAGCGTQADPVPGVQVPFAHAPANPALSDGQTRIIDRLRARRFPMFGRPGATTGPAN